MIPAITAWFLFALAICVGAYDLYAAYALGDEHTVTNAIWLLSQRFPVVPFLLGMVFGHLLWPTFRHR